jgi:hypothetical protein
MMSSRPTIHSNARLPDCGQQTAKVRAIRALCRVRLRTQPYGIAVERRSEGAVVELSLKAPLPSPIATAMARVRAPARAALHRCRSAPTWFAQSTWFAQYCDFAGVRPRRQCLSGPHNGGHADSATDAPRQSRENISSFARHQRSNRDFCGAGNGACQRRVASSARRRRFWRLRPRPSRSAQ